MDLWESMGPGLSSTSPHNNSAIRDVVAVGRQCEAPGEQSNPASREMLDRRWANIVTYIGATPANDVEPT